MPKIGERPKNDAALGAKKLESSHRMAHSLTALLLRDEIDPAAVAEFDLRPVSLPQSVTMVPIDHYFTAYWQAVRKLSGHLDVPDGVPATFPTEMVLRVIACSLSQRATPRFALVMTEYFGGAGDQWACVFDGETRVSASSATINDALRILGVVRANGVDEFDTLGLGGSRSAPEYLRRYVALCDDLGV